VTNNYFITFITTHSARKRLTRDETRERIMIKADELFRQFRFRKNNSGGYRRRVGHVAGKHLQILSSKEAIIQASCDRKSVVLSEAVQRHMVASARHWIESKRYS